MDQQRRLGLALSGGGYRAAAFHLGTLNKLHEMGILDEVDVMSTISGGSITGAAWCLHEGDYPSFHQYMKESLRTKNVIQEIFLSLSFLKLSTFITLTLGTTLYLTFTAWAPLALPVLTLMIFLLLKFQFTIFPVSKEVERAYNKFFFHHKTLSQLNNFHLLAIGSSNLQTGRPFTFSQKKMGDTGYTQGKPPVFFKHEEFPIARAVMASSCVPFAFTPVTIHPSFFKNPADAGEINPQLVDGGVYDNQGIQKITQPKSSYLCDIIITSDAGGGLGSSISFRNTIALLIRTVDIFMHRIKTMQMVEHVYQNVIEGNKPIAYLSLGWEITRLVPGFISNMRDKLVLPTVLASHGLPKEWIEDPETYRSEIQEHLERRIGYAGVLQRNLNKEEWIMAKSTGTNLTTLSQQRIDCLIRHAENLTELQVKLYCPMIVSKEHSPNPAIPANTQPLSHGKSSLQ